MTACNFQSDHAFISLEHIRSTLPLLAVCLHAHLSGAISIVLDYSYDTGDYFTDERKYIAEQAAYAFESRLGSESFGQLDPAHYSSSLDFWVSTKNPTTMAGLNIDPGVDTDEGNSFGDEDTIVILMGAKAVGTTNQYLAVANSGFGYSGVADGTFLDYWNDTRNSTTNFDSVGGSISFNSSYSFYEDTDLTTHSDATTSGKPDFYSVMAHEIGHIMGFSTVWDAWNNDLSGSNWTGTNGKAAYNNQNIPMDSASKSHFGTLTTSHINCDCHPSMNTTSPNNTRRGFSELDFALLKDIGYSISASPQGTNIGGTYTDPDLGGNFYIPVEKSYSAWLSGDSGSATSAPEPAIVFPVLGLAAFGILYLRNRKTAKDDKAHTDAAA